MGKVMQQWWIGQILQQTSKKFQQDCRKLPRQVWRQWGLILALGFGLTAGLTAGLTLVARSRLLHGLQAWDERWLPLAVTHLPLNFAQGITWESPGNLVYLGPLIVTGLGWMIGRSRPLWAATWLAAYIGQLALVWVGWLLWNRARPELIANGIAAPDLHSFPSGHATVVWVVYGFLAYLWWRAAHHWLERLTTVIVSLLWIAVVSSARLVLGAHWPSDVLAGWLIGLVWLVVVIVALERAEAIARRRRV